MLRGPAAGLHFGWTAPARPRIRSRYAIGACPCWRVRLPEVHQVEVAGRSAISPTVVSVSAATDRPKPKGPGTGNAHVRLRSSSVQPQRRAARACALMKGGLHVRPPLVSLLATSAHQCLLPICKRWAPNERPAPSSTSVLADESSCPWSAASGARFAAEAAVAQALADHPKRAGQQAHQGLALVAEPAGSQAPRHRSKRRHAASSEPCIAGVQHRFKCESSLNGNTPPPRPPTQAPRPAPSPRLSRRAATSRECSASAACQRVELAAGSHQYAPQRGRPICWPYCPVPAARGAHADGEIVTALLRGAALSEGLVSAVAGPQEEESRRGRRRLPLSGRRRAAAAWPRASTTPCAACGACKLRSRVAIARRAKRRSDTARSLE